MVTTVNQEVKELKTEIGIRKHQVRELEKELARMESEQNEELGRRYEA